MLESWARQLMLDASTVDEEGCEASLRTVAQVLDDMAVLTQSAGVMCVGEAGPVSKALSGMSSVQLGVASEHSVTSCPRYLKRCEANAVTVSCHDALGEVVKTVTPGDVTIGWSDSTVEGWSVCGPPTVGNGVVHVYILPTEEAECNVTLCVVIDCTRFHIPLSVSSMSPGLWFAVVRHRPYDSVCAYTGRLRHHRELHSHGSDAGSVCKLRELFRPCRQSRWHTFRRFKLRLALRVRVQRPRRFLGEHIWKLRQWTWTV